MAGWRARGAGPYVAPYALFLVLVELEGWVGPPGAAWMLPLKGILPGALFAIFALRGSYPELRGFRARPVLLLDAALGLGLAALWLAPFVWFEGLPRGGGPFDPEGLGPDRRELALGLRLLGFAGVTPLVEELFVRSFLLRWADVLWEGRGDFRALAIGRFAWPSFVITTLWFTFSHVPWEWVVAAPTGALLTLWLYARRHIGAAILAHAVTNATIWVLVVSGAVPAWEFL